MLRRIASPAWALAWLLVAVYALPAFVLVYELDLYERETAPLIAWYLARDLLVEVAGLGPAEDVTARLIAVIDERRI